MQILMTAAAQQHQILIILPGDPRPVAGLPDPVVVDMMQVQALLRPADQARHLLPARLDRREPRPPSIEPRPGAQIARLVALVTAAP
ncbi:hypothetical protein EDL96_12820 [Kocuria soli]|uniref:Uncharacterized protein n=1 Tax=Kocuria soli TaxID=2485125 RepID=A0A3N3ZTW9_9MICC|nr:hypothetical protein EDL96_12820 [Kocuria soli]